MNKIDQLIKIFNEDKPIEQTIGNYIELSKNGANYWGLCPFHSDSKPSLSVSPSKKIFKCFSCGAGGNAINFVQRFMNVSFLDTLKELSKIYTIDFTNYYDEKVKKYTEDQKLIFEINQASLDFFKFQITKLEYSELQEYLKKRKIDEILIEKYQLGFNPGNKLYEYLIKRGYSVQDLQLAKIAKNDQSILRDRLIFPIIEEDGYIHGFSGRTIDDSKISYAKYINTEENLVFHKTNTLWNINNIGFIEDSLIIFEGFMDVISWEALSNTKIKAVASMGTAFNESLIKRIKSRTNHIIIGFDKDQVGIQNSIKIANQFIKNNFIVEILSFEKYKDIDELLQNNGSFSFKSYHLWFIDDYLINLQDINNLMDYSKLPSRQVEGFLDAYKDSKEYILVERYFKQKINLSEVFFKSPKQSFKSDPFDFFDNFHQKVEKNDFNFDPEWEKFNQQSYELSNLINLKEKEYFSYLLNTLEVKEFLKKVNHYEWQNDNLQNIINSIPENSFRDYLNDLKNEFQTQFSTKNALDLIEDMESNLVYLSKKSNSLNLLIKKRNTNEDSAKIGEKILNLMKET